MERGVYEVWQVKEEVLRELVTVRRPVLIAFPHDFERVARVKARDLEEAFEKTSSQDRPWWRKPGVECLKASRPTMVGDIVISPKEEIYQVLPEGWKLVGRLAQEQARAKEQAPAPAEEKKPTPEEARLQKPRIIH